jgi:hypothetical protein
MTLFVLRDPIYRERLRLQPALGAAQTQDEVGFLWLASHSTSQISHCLKFTLDIIRIVRQGGIEASEQPSPSETPPPLGMYAWKSLPT